MPKRGAGVLLAAVALGCDGFGGSAPRAGYYVVSTTGIAAEGRVIAGFSEAGDFAGHDAEGAFRVHQGTLQRLGSLAGATQTLTFAMNAGGDIVGSAQVGGVTRPLRWLADATVPLEPSFGATVAPADINDAGEVLLATALYSQAEQRDTAVILWTPAGRQTLRLPADAWTSGLVFPSHLNDRRHLLASVMISNLGVVAVRSAGTTVDHLDCDVSGGWRSEGPVAMNDSGAFVVSGGDRHCARFPGGGMMSLRFHVAPRGLNNNGRMIGFADGTSGAAIPVVSVADSTYEPVSRLFRSDQDTGDWEIVALRAINDRNEILAEGIRSGAREFVILRPRVQD